MHLLIATDVKFVEQNGDVISLNLLNWFNKKTLIFWQLRDV